MRPSVLASLGAMALCTSMVASPPAGSYYRPARTSSSTSSLYNPGAYNGGSYTNTGYTTRPYGSGQSPYTSRTSYSGGAYTSGGTTRPIYNTPTTTGPIRPTLRYPPPSYHPSSSSRSSSARSSSGRSSSGQSSSGRTSSGRSSSGRPLTYSGSNTNYSGSNTTYSGSNTNYSPRSNASTYSPPQQTYTSPQQTYTPPQPTYTPPQPTYTPPQPTYTPPQPTYTPPQATSGGGSSVYHGEANTGGPYGASVPENNGARYQTGSSGSMSTGAAHEPSPYYSEASGISYDGAARVVQPDTPSGITNIAPHIPPHAAPHAAPHGTLQSAPHSADISTPLVSGGSPSTSVRRPTSSGTQVSNGGVTFRPLHAGDSFDMGDHESVGTNHSGVTGHVDSGDVEEAVLPVALGPAALALSRRREGRGERAAVFHAAYDSWYNPYADPLAEEFPESPFHDYAYTEDAFPSAYSTHSFLEDYGVTYSNRYYHEEPIPPRLSYEQWKQVQEENEAIQQISDEEKARPIVGVVNPDTIPLRGIMGETQTSYRLP